MFIADGSAADRHYTFHVSKHASSWGSRTGAVVHFLVTFGGRITAEPPQMSPGVMHTPPLSILVTQRRSMGL